MILLARKRQAKVAALKDPPSASLLFWAQCAVEHPTDRAAHGAPASRKGEVFEAL